MLVDSFGRRIDYLRLSVTDRCNLRCAYCLPVSHRDFSPRGEIMTDAEIAELVSCFAELGVRAVRVTGGEPLVRPGLAALIARLAALGLEDLALSTNGVLLAPAAAGLKRAGLRRVNISLDSRDERRFAEITRFGRLCDALAGIDAALAADLAPVKVNVVVARGLNLDEVGDFAAWTLRLPVHVRFIELMPMGAAGFFTRERWAPMDEIRREAGPLEPAGDARPAGRGPAAYFRAPGARGTVGFISALSCGFCASCNRVRLSARGRLVPCLDGEDGADLLGPLRRGAGRESLKELIAAAVRAKPEGHAMRARAAGANRFMCQVGG